MHQLQIQNDNRCKTSSQTNKQVTCVFFWMLWSCAFFLLLHKHNKACMCTPWWAVLTFNKTGFDAASLSFAPNGPDQHCVHAPECISKCYSTLHQCVVSSVSRRLTKLQRILMWILEQRFYYFFSAEVSFGRMCLHVDLEPHLRESWQPETWGERVCRSWLLPCWQRQADRTLWRARPIASGLWYSHRSVWPVETTECWSRCCCQGGQHSYHLGDADWHCAAVPLLPAAAAHRQPVCAAAPWGWVWWVCGELFAVFFLWREVSGLILTKCSLRHCHFVFLVQTGCAKFVKANRIAEFLDKKTDCTQDCVTGMMSQDVTGCHSCESASPHLNQICRFYFSCLKLNGVVTVARFCSFYSDFFESVMAVPSDMLRHLSICAALVNSAASFEPPPNQTKHIVHSLQGSYLVSSGIYIYIYIQMHYVWQSTHTHVVFSWCHAVYSFNVVV